MKNPINNINCTACLEHKPGHRISLQEDQNSVPQSGVVKPRLSFRIRALFSNKPPDWECPNCTVVNGGYYTQCQTCRFLRITDKPSRRNSSRGEGRVRRRKESVPEETEEEASVMNSVLGFFRRLSMAGGRQGEGRGNSGKTARETGGTGEQWSCQQCTLLNPSELEKCSACKTRRPSDGEANGESSAGHLESDHPPSSLHHSEEYAPVHQHPVPHQRRLSDSQVFPTHHRNHQFANDRGFPTPESQWQEPTHEDNFMSLPAMGSPSPNIESRGLVSLVTSQGAPTWQCNICGAYNVVMRTLHQCYICGIGVIPECYLPSSPTGGASDITQASGGAQAAAISPRHHRGFQGERPHNGGSGDSGPLGQQRLEHLQSADCQSSKQKHSLTHHNDLGVPERNVCSNEGDHPPLEQPRDQYTCTNGYCAKEFSRDSNPNIQAKDRGLPSQSKQQDQHIRPRTPTSQSRVQAPAKKREARHQRQRSDEGARVHWLEESIQFNRTKCLNEIRHEDVIMANAVYQGIQLYCREVSTEGEGEGREGLREVSTGGEGEGREGLREVSTRGEGERREALWEVSTGGEGQGGRDLGR